MTAVLQRPVTQIALTGESFARPGTGLQMFRKVASVEGFFNHDDAQHFSLLLKMQTAMGIRGDLLEIGTWKGRSASFLAFHLQPGEKLYLNDVFANPAIDTYSTYPEIDEVRSTILAFSPEVGNQLVFLKGDSTKMALPASAQCRFAHVDGGHSVEECYSDLAKVAPLVIPNGIVAVDDYDHPDWPGVKPATDRWLSESPQFRTIGDLNRAGAKGRKLYAVRSS